MGGRDEPTTPSQGGNSYQRAGAVDDLEMLRTMVGRIF